MKHDLRACIAIPPRILVLEKKDGTGTSVIYHLPSSIMPLGDNEDLKAAAKALDDQMDQLATRVTAV